MKKSLLVLCLLLSFSFYANNDDKISSLNFSNLLNDADVIGTWSLDIDWDCDSDLNFGDITFVVDYTFTSTGGFTGTWSCIDDIVTWTHTTGAHAVYTGTIDGNSIIGTIATDNSDNAGCFTAEKNVASQDDFTIFNFNYYPNPVEDTLNLSANQLFSSVKIYSLLGQKVISINPKNKKDLQVDLSSLNSGIYLVKVKIGDKTNTLKIIKN